MRFFLSFVAFVIVLVLVGFLADRAFAGEIYSYQAPDGSLAFTDDQSRVPAVAKSTVKRVTPTARWTYVKETAVPYVWHPAPQRDGAWVMRAEAARRQIENAAALRVLSDELRVGQSASRLHEAQTLDRAERLEDACRMSGSCLPGDLRRP